jgi:hypothetical protein
MGIRRISLVLMIVDGVDVVVVVIMAGGNRLTGEKVGGGEETWLLSASAIRMSFVLVVVEGLL